MEQVIVTITIIGMIIYGIIYVISIIPAWVWFAVFGIIVFILFMCAVRGSRTSSSSSDYSSSYSGGGTTSSGHPAKVNPLFDAKKIDKAILSDNKILRNSSGEKIGRLEKALLSNDQIIRDSNGKKTGRIEQSIWDKDRQIIRDTDGKKEGEIKTNFWGDRIIVDESGKEMGKIEKNFWGETVIKKK